MKSLDSQLLYGYAKSGNESESSNSSNGNSPTASSSSNAADSLNLLDLIVSTLNKTRIFFHLLSFVISLNGAISELLYGKQFGWTDAVQKQFESIFASQFAGAERTEIHSTEQFTAILSTDANAAATPHAKQSIVYGGYTASNFRFKSITSTG